MTYSALVGDRKVLSPLSSRLAVLVLIVLAVLLAGCNGSRGGPIAYDQGNFAPPDPASTLILEGEHKVGPGDVVTVTVFQVDSMSGDREVDTLGRIQMPLIGAIPVVGKTTAQIGEDLTQRFNATYLKNPRVQVSLKAVKQQTFTMDGSVKQPGVYPINGQLSLPQAVAIAKGTDSDANPKRVVIFRQIDGKRQAAAFDLTTIRTAQDPDPSIYPNDLIVVDGSKSRQAFRDFISSVPLLSVFRPF